MKIVYLVHDLADAAVHRRVQMFQIAGQAPALLGFRRSPAPVAQVAGLEAIDLGRTEDARLQRRAASILGTAARLGRWRDIFGGADVIVARNLEMLLIGWLARMRFAPGARLVYECLDIHTMLVGPGRKERAMRALEARLLRACAGLVISSHAFLTHHFAAYGKALPGHCLLENKVLATEIHRQDDAGAGAIAAAPPWRIGWFGVIRCQRSLELLAGLLRALPGMVEVDIRGRPARNVVPDFDAIVAATPGMIFHGPYDRAHDLGRIYGAVHFTWAMDFYESGANSAWLLPNRLYEGGAHATIPIADRAVATGQWLCRHQMGVVLAEPLPAALTDYFRALTPAMLIAEQNRAAATPAACFVASRDDIADFVAWLSAPHRATTLVDAS